LGKSKLTSQGINMGSRPQLCPPETYAVATTSTNCTCMTLVSLFAQVSCSIARRLRSCCSEADPLTPSGRCQTQGIGERMALGVFEQTASFRKSAGTCVMRGNSPMGTEPTMDPEKLHTLLPGRLSERTVQDIRSPHPK